MGKANPGAKGVRVSKAPFRANLNNDKTAGCERGLAQQNVHVPWPAPLHIVVRDASRILTIRSRGGRSGHSIPSMAVSSRATYLAEVRQAVTQALCLMDYPSPHVEGHNKPIVEVEGLGHALIAAPIVLSRGPSEGCLVEHSINSSRISLRFKAQDEMERCIIDTHLKYLMHRCGHGV